MANNLKKIVSSSLAFGMAAVLAACSGGQAQSGKSSEISQTNSASASAQSTTKSMKIYTSFYPMHEFTKQVVGDKAEVINLMPAGSSSHDWEPSTKQIAELSEADVLVYQGAGMEEWVDSVKDTLEAEGSKLKFIEASEGLTLLEGHHHHHEDEETEAEHEEHDEHSENHDEHSSEHGDHAEHDEHEHATDPHLWLSIRNSAKMVENIETQIAKIDPANADIYADNAKQYIGKLNKLDTKYTEELASNSVKSFMITHEAFGYLANDYNLQQYGLTGMGTEQDPNPEKMAEMVKLVKAEKMKAIYYDDSGSDKLCQVLAKEVGNVEVLPLTTMHSPTEELLASGADYISLMEKNLEQLCKNSSK